MKIIFTANSTWNIWNFRLPIIKHFIKQGHKIHIVAPKDNSYALLENIGCTVHNININAKGINPFQEVFLIQVLKNEKELSRII